MNTRTDLLWQAAIGFLGFFAALALVQAVLNLFQPGPAIWPGLFAGALVAATWWLVRRWRRWRVRARRSGHTLKTEP
ncbi:hypothetical protein [Corynebacterium timonense]|uniref:PEP-CTERM protein-sorting domain-containing protein n=1 Tax=Corynebacterium timonense TaxID=441500 RepID=A0A1H1RUV7_9CORY|nr:hypothetical protein [Corynebacterium timonense]SDS39306.1 PEP-CTERM protein-sorting domain-containing protein [Corynebacterium timonense]